MGMNRVFKKDPTHGLFRIPTKEERIKLRAGAPLNPLKVLCIPGLMEWLWFLGGLFAWIMDAYDFFSVSMSVTKLVTTFFPTIRDGTPEYDDKVKQVNYSIMLTLLFRPLGAVIFGILADRLGRRWILSVNLLIVAALSIGTAYCEQYGSFLGVRCIFGIGMGGIWGMATATALENMKPAARGLFSGILQQGYAMGYLIAAGVNLGWANKTMYQGEEGNWRVLFYLGAGLSLAAAIVRALLPESPIFIEQQRLRKLQPVAKNPALHFLKELGQMLKKEWMMCIYAVLLMTGFNFFSHSSQDLYPTMLQKAKLLTADQSSTATIISNCGAITGGLIAGYVSQYTGRRIAMIIFIIIGGAMVPAWILPDSFGGLAAGGFFVQVGVQGAWGVIPVYLTEISPAAFRATFPGVAYQLGNMASSASSTIETTGGNNIRIPDPKHPGETIADTATVSAILLGCVAGYLLILVVFGVESDREIKVCDDDPHAKSANEVLLRREMNDIEAAANGPNPELAYVNDKELYEHVNGVPISDTKKEIA
ncbi:hypothetical protein MVES1_002618 [Malassezia vespertilionis]|uniref:Major facilitator superfamily (MFS) profile domain-containing protein n=1 Tax=Malassezia vespertilionis TaxID=2020962 RepID=A0A2N1JAH5_9BASI|nr:uncharacterized protein MVES1_002618 [Malassezia vespertilionis]PKI83555.1 hypothetical protein MVES_002472 [Malassezia vespertilionis]WFD07258.1 hypothetical protein MVES1_002618 [Malassezia vespertilionis]